MTGDPNTEARAAALNSMREPFMELSPRVMAAATIIGMFVNATRLARAQPGLSPQVSKLLADEQPVEVAFGMLMALGVTGEELDAATAFLDLAAERVRRAG